MYHGRRKLFYEVAGPLLQTLHNSNCAERADLIKLSDIDPYYPEREIAEPKRRVRPTRGKRNPT